MAPVFHYDSRSAASRTRSVRQRSRTIQVDIHRDVRCSQEIAFDYMTDPRNDLEWWLGVLETRITSPGDHGVGTTYTQRCRLMGLRFEIAFECLAYDRPRMIHLKTTSGITPFEAEYTFEPLAGGGTRVRLTGPVRGDGLLFKLAGPLFRSILNRQTERYFDNLKRILDEKAASTAAA